MWRTAGRLARRCSRNVILQDSIFIRSYCATEFTSSQGTSKVLHLRNIGSSVSEKEIRELVRPFGSVVNVVHLQHQALVQMETVEQASSVVEHFSSEEARLGNRNIFIQYSSHQEITPPQQDHGHILFVYIRNPLHPISVSVLHRVFRPYGDIKKIVISQKSGIQGLIEFCSEESASEAKLALNGREIFDDCCKMDIGFSKLKELQVIYNTELARDFSDDLLPQHGGFPPMVKPSILGPGSVSAEQATLHPAGVNTGYNRRRMLLISNLNAEKMNADKLFKFFSPYGKILRIKHLKERDKALVQMDDGFQAELAMNFLRGAEVFGKRMEIALSKLLFLNHQMTREYMDDPNNRFQVVFAKNCCAPSNVLHAGNLPPDVEVDEVIEFMAPHSALKVKIFDSLAKDIKKQALIEFKSTEDATNALINRQYLPMRELRIRLAFSKTTRLDEYVQV